MSAKVELLPYVHADRLTTFGVVPTKPETGYGYIRRGSQAVLDVSIPMTVGDNGVFTVDAFIEKPNLTTAKSYIDSGDYYWNSGMFMFKASCYIKELQRCAPKILACCHTALDKAQTDLDFIRLDIEAFSSCPSESIDYAIMEKTQNSVVIPLDAGWNDVGSWSALWEIGNKNADDNVIRGDVITYNTTNSYLHSSQRLVAAVGIDNLVVVETADAVLVAHRDKVQNVKEIVTELQELKRGEADTHLKVVRPWGSYETIDLSERFKVKRITVTPGAKLSLQMHHHRAEHWVVVKGTAKVSKDDDVFILSENQSTYIPLGVIHCLENPGMIPLELIEVQSGSYLEEDDIVRFEDYYGMNCE